MVGSSNTDGFKRWLDGLFDNPAFRLVVALVLLEWGYSQGARLVNGFVAGVKSLSGL